MYFDFPHRHRGQVTGYIAYSGCDCGRLWVLYHPLHAGTDSAIRMCKTLQNLTQNCDHDPGKVRPIFLFIVSRQPLVVK